jgi:predicted Zn-dependent protease
VAARDVIEEGVRALEGNLPACVELSEALLEASAPERAAELLSPLIEREDVPESVQPAILRVLATALARANKERLADADAYSEHALSLAPHDPECGLARAYVLTELGRIHEAARLFEELKGAVHERTFADTRDAYMALLELRRGHGVEALSLLRSLEERGARGAALEEVRAALS